MSTHSLLFRILTKTNEFNRRDIKNAAVRWEELALYRQTIKLDMYQRFLQTVDQTTDPGARLQLARAWCLLVESERLYADTLKLKAFHDDINLVSSFDFQTDATIDPPDVSPSKAKPKDKGSKSVGYNYRKLFPTLRKNSGSKAKIHVPLNERLSEIQENINRDLVTDFGTFVTCCKRFALVESEDTLNLVDLLNANKKVHTNLWILTEKIQAIYRSVYTDIRKLEHENPHVDTMKVFLETWSVYKVIFLGFIDALKLICTELRKSEAFRKLSTVKSWAAYLDHERNVNKMFIKHISNLIVQLSVNFPNTRGFNVVINEMKDCLNLFWKK